MSTTIRKALISGFGDPSNVSIITAEIPSPSSNEVQVKIIYSGMGGSDIQMRMGTYPNQKKAPFTPGYTLVGRVHRTGSSKSKFNVGDMVACLSKYDAHADLANLPEKYLIPVPEGLDLQQAVAMVLDWTTAYGMVYRTAKVFKGQRVFIHGLSGAVGFAILSLCKLQGAECYGTASESNHAALLEYGAVPFTYKNKDWMDSMKNMGGAHIVFDPLGFESYDESWSILANDGHLIGYGGNSKILNGEEPRSQYPSLGKLMMKNLCMTTKRKASFFYIDKDQSTFVPELKALFDLSLQGKIHVPIKRFLTLEEYPEAHRTWNKTTGIGSVVVKISDDGRA